MEGAGRKLSSYRGRRRHPKRTGRVPRTLQGGRGLDESSGSPTPLRRGLPVPGLVAAGEDAPAGRPLVREPHRAGRRGETGRRVRRGPAVVAPPARAARKVPVARGRLL